TGTAGAPVLVRSLTGQTNPYGFYIWRTAATIPQVSMDYVEFQHLNADGLCLGGRPVAGATTDKGLVTINSFSNITFKNNTAASSRHLTLRQGTNTQTFDRLSFDNSTVQDVFVASNSANAHTVVTFTNWNVGRPVPISATIGVAGSYCVWTAYGTNRRAAGTGLRRWDDPAHWLDDGDNPGIPGPNDTVTIGGTRIMEVPASTTVYACRAMTIESGAYLQFRPDLGSTYGGGSPGNITFQIANGGAISALGTANGNVTVKNDSGSTYTVTLETQNPATDTPFIFGGNYVGGNIYWNMDRDTLGYNNVAWRIRGIDFRQGITFTQSAGITIIGSIWTGEVNVQRGTTVTFNPLATATWLARGNVTVGFGASGPDGVLNIVGEESQGANLILACTSMGQYGLIVTGFGTLTATGTSSAVRNATISSLTDMRGYIYCQPSSVSKFQFCTIYNLGDWVGGDRTKFGLCISGVDGATAGHGNWIDSCTIRDGFRGIHYENSSNHTGAGKGITNNTIYDMTNACIVLDNNSSTNTINGNTLYNSYWGGLIVRRGSNNNTFSNNTAFNHTRYGAREYNTSGNLYLNENYYNNGVGLMLGGSAVSGTTGLVLRNCWFGVVSPSGSAAPNQGYDPFWGQGDIVVTTTLTGQVYQAVLENCRLGSPIEVNWLQPSPGAGSYIISSRHDQVNGAVRVWGDYVVDSGTVNWNTTEPSYPSGLDAGSVKTVRFMPGPTGLNSGRSRFRLGPLATLNMASGNSAVLRTTLISDNTNYPGELVISGTINASGYTLDKMGSNGLYLTGQAVSITSIANGIFQNSVGVTPSAHIRIDSPSFGTLGNIGGCSFDNSTLYDLRVNIGSSTITFTNFSNDPPIGGSKDLKDSGDVVWLPPLGFTSVVSGNWSAPATWGGSIIPQGYDAVTVTTGKNVVITGTANCGNIWVQSGATLTLNAQNSAVNLVVWGGSTIAN
ncbi:MAG: right-handed parallel beta-helix repeat-containing protein, partial [Planctomycetota bacterium]|nr:right-handed parallel beta-helix repeat-containing protein [Planctomycetota bacterium]